MGQKMSDKALQTSQEKTGVIKTFSPTPRNSEKVGFIDFVKEWGISFIIAKGAFLAGFLFAKSSKGKFDPIITGTVTGILALYYEAYKHWNKNKKKQIEIKDIHQDILKTSAPQYMMEELEHNQRIQDEIKQIISERKNNNHVDTVSNIGSLEKTH